MMLSPQGCPLVDSHLWSQRPQVELDPQVYLLQGYADHLEKTLRLGFQTVAIIQNHSDERTYMLRENMKHDKENTILGHKHI